MKTPKEFVDEQVKSLENEIERRNKEIESFTAQIEALKTENKFDESVLKIRKEQQSKLK